MSPSVDRIAYRPAEAAAALGISRSRVYELMEQGRLPYRQLDGVRLIPATALYELLTDEAVPAMPPPDASRRPVRDAGSTRDSFFDPAPSAGSTNVAVGRHVEP